MRSKVALFHLFRLLIPAIFLLIALDADAQFREVPSERSIYGGAVLRTNGWGGLLGVKGLLVPADQSIQLDLVTHRHPREIKIINPSVQNPRAYVFGKLYHTALLRLDWGIERELVRRNDWNRLGLTGRLQAGPTFGIQRPVYLSIYRPGVNDMIGIIRSERYDPDVHTSQDNILGYSDKRNGWDELEYHAGMNAQISFDLQWTGDNGGFKSLRIGGAADYFPGGLPIMALTENPDLSLTLFLSLIWGS
ncbi:MAG: hypothetical protein H6606_11320 [Flavobacteriales bacterium]|nr:hypothetical protein [Flavobacteriales bacterium]